MILLWRGTPVSPIWKGANPPAIWWGKAPAIAFHCSPASLDFCDPDNILLQALILLRSEISSGMSAKLHTVAASNNRDHARNLSYYCLLVLHIQWWYSSRTSRSWWITQSTQHHRRGCNNMLIILILDKTNRMSFLTSILFRYFDLIFTKLEKPVSHWNVVVKGRTSFDVIISHGTATL